MRATNPLRVMLADDHPVVLAGIQALLAVDPDLVIVGSASDGLEAIRMAIELHPDVLVLDMSMPGLNGVTVARRLRDSGASCKIIALTVHEEAAYLRQLLELGMGGYVLKRSAADALVRAIRIVADGGVYLDPAIAGQIVDTTMRRAHDNAPAKAADLSEREEDVLRMTAMGHSNKVIARELAIGVKTVESYKARATEKLGFKSRVDVIRYALGKGWLDEA